MHVGTKWARASLAVLTAFATALQIASWVWPTSRDWINGHGLVLLAWSMVLLIALSVALWRQPAPAGPAGTSAPVVPHKHSELSEDDRELLLRLYHGMPPNALLDDQIDADRASALFKIFVQTMDPHFSFHDEKLDDMKRTAISALYKWKVLYARGPNDPQDLTYLATDKSSKAHSYEMECKHTYRQLWQRAKSLGY